MSGAVETVADHLRWRSGGHAELVRIDREAVELRSTTPAPPGARLEATLTVDPGIAVTIKSHGTRREADGVYALKGRLLSATREILDRLATLPARVE